MIIWHNASLINTIGLSIQIEELTADWSLYPAELITGWRGSSSGFKGEMMNFYSLRKQNEISIFF